MDEPTPEEVLRLLESFRGAAKTFGAPHDFLPGGKSPEKAMQQIESSLGDPAVLRLMEATNATRGMTEEQIEAYSRDFHAARQREFLAQGGKAA